MNEVNDLDRITFVIPSRNNLEFLRLAYKSIKDLNGNHEILILDDASTDGTSQWIESLNDDMLMVYHNTGPDRVGIVGMFDRGIKMARTDIIMAFHADMVACRDFDKNILKHLKPGCVVSATRVEPPLHPPGPEKIIENFGIEVDEFDFKKWYRESESHKKVITTEGIFAPWCMYKDDFLSIGGHDELFAPQSKEDSDLFNRFQLNGYTLIQSWDALVYHFTSRGSRFNKHSGGSAGKNSDEWLAQNTRSTRNFIRKWGHFVKHDSLMKPIIPSKYDIQFNVKNGNAQVLNILEPWCSRIVMDIDDDVIKKYIELEQPNTQFDLSDRINTGVDSDIEISFDANRLTQYSYNLITELSTILDSSEIEVGEFELDIFNVKVNRIQTYEMGLIHLN